MYINGVQFACSNKEYMFKGGTCAMWFGVYVVVQFYPWFKFYFPLFQTHYHTLPYPKTKENEI